jgi:hypothetical protein
VASRSAPPGGQALTAADPSRLWGTLEESIAASGAPAKVKADGDTIELGATPIRLSGVASPGERPATRPRRPVRGEAEL